MAKNSAVPSSKNAPTKSMLVYNCPGPLAPTTPNSVWVVNTNWIMMLLCAPRSTTTAKLVWVINKNCVMVLHLLFPL